MIFNIPNSGKKLCSCVFLGGFNETLTITQGGISKEYLCDSEGKTTEEILLYSKKDITVLGSDTGFTRTLQIKEPGTFTAYPEATYFWRGQKPVAWTPSKTAPTGLGGSYTASSTASWSSNAEKIGVATGGSSNHKKGFYTEPLDVTKYKYLHFSVNCSMSSSNGYGVIGLIADGVALESTPTVYKKINGATAKYFTLDVSELSGLYELVGGVYVVKNTSTYGISVNQAWLSNNESTTEG